MLQFGLILRMVIRRLVSTSPAIHHHVLGFSQPLHSHRQSDSVAFSHFSKGLEKWMNNFSSNTYWKQNINMIRTYWETVSKTQILTKRKKPKQPKNNKKTPQKERKMVICICIRKKEKQFISTSIGNYCKCRYPQVKYCPTTYNHIWNQRLNSKANKLLRTTQF